MSKTLVLAEKPSVGRDLAKVLKCNQNKGGYIEGPNYIVTWALGHLVTLLDPEGYGDKYKKWSMETLPMLPKPMKLTVIQKTARQFNEVKKQMLRPDVSDLVIATDAGREGELVARWIIEKVGCKKPLKRLWISSQTDKAILDGFRNLKPGSAYENLYKAAQARAEADWIIGLNVTRALTCKYNAQLSAGRVQSPTVSMIAQREEDIKNFRPKDYYTIIGHTNDFSMEWTNKDNTNRLYDETLAKKIIAAAKGKDGEVIEITESNKKQYAPALYDLTELQRDGNRIFGYSAKQTLSIMQRLYENYKILTYPRTDSRYITRDIVPTLKDRLKAISVSNYTKSVTEILKGTITPSRSFVDDSKVTDHHAIIPTEQRVSLGSLSSDERNIYDLVIKRFLSVLLPPFEFIQTGINVKIGDEIFRAKGKVITSKGWKMVYDKADDLEETSEEGILKEQVLPKLSRGNKIKINNVEIKNHKTKPPARFNEGTLLSAMENPQKYMSIDKESAKTLGDTGGLGTVATRADIIEKLFNSFVIEKKGKELFPTSKGKQLMELVPKDLKSPLLTAKWEKELDDISKGKTDVHDFIGRMRNYATALVQDVKFSTDKYTHDNLTGKKCPQCGKYMLEVKGKIGVMNVCQDRECGYRESVSKVTNARCPDCKKKLELRGHGDGAIYICASTTCNFREKASQFQKRFDGKGKVDKREVNNYMNKMKKESEEFNDNPFAALLGGMKFDDR